MRDWLSRSALRVENVGIIKAIKDGFAGIMPVLLIGAFIFMLVELEIPLYLDAMRVPGIYWHITFEQIYRGALGIIPMAVVISVSYTLALHSPHYSSRVLSPLVPSLVGFSCLLLLTAVPGFGARFVDIGPGGVFLAVVVAVVSHLLFFFFYRFRLIVVRPKAATAYLAQVVLLLEPVLFTILVFGVLRYAFNVFGIYNIPNHITERVINMLAGIYNGINSPVLFVMIFTFMYQLLWFFGLHNGEIVPSVAEHVDWSYVLCPDFFQFFVLAGGGGALALIVAILIVRSKSASRPALFSLPMGLANIGTPVLYGLPVLFNPILIIPFIFAPMVSGMVARIAVSAGMNATVIAGVSSTLPPGISGWMATGSLMAGFIQVLTLAISVLIYLPFVWIANNTSEERSDFAIEELMSRDAAPYLARKDDVGVFARSLFEEMEYDLRRGRGFYLEYQPMIDSHNRMVSFEARVRYRHASLGPLPPQLVHALAEEGRLLGNINIFVMEDALATLHSLRENGFTDLLMTINLSPKELSKPKTIKIIKDMLAKYNIDPTYVRIILSSHEVLDPGFDPWTLMSALSAIGLRVIINNFSLQLTHFSNLQRMGIKAIKLSSALTHEVQFNELSANVIKDIVEHAKPMTISAEDIESKAQYDLLVELGCEIFQGKYFSKPMETADLSLYLRLK
ncbi:MAG: EAL domain-containing protein [Defluviitaleaceae bacterium]|nr:EAL domain-containing protein [Defluviitaleaceae bacterium]